MTTDAQYTTLLFHIFVLWRFPPGLQRETFHYTLVIYHLITGKARWGPSNDVPSCVSSQTCEGCLSSEKVGLTAEVHTG